jgi:hypothetical protein
MQKKISRREFIGTVVRFIGGLIIVKASFILPQARISEETTTTTITLSPSAGRRGIQDAIDNKLPSSGGNIKLLNGTYNLDDDIKITKSNVTIYGESRSGVLLKRTANFSGAFTAGGKSNIAVRTMTIDIQETTQNNDGISIIGFEECSDVKISNITMRNCDKMGIIVRRCNEVVINNCHISNTWNGIVSQSSRNVDITNNYTRTTHGDAIYITQDFYKQVSYGSQDVLVKNNDIRQWADTAIDDSVSDTSYRNARIYIEDNTIVNSLTSSISTDNNELGITISRTTDTHINGNTVNDCIQCINIGVENRNSDGSKLQVKDNTLSNFRTKSLTVPANVDFSYNRVDGAKATAACIDIRPGASLNSLITNNTLTNGSKYGIYWAGDAQALTIDNNTIVNPRIYGIYDNNKWTTNSKVTNNTIKDTKSTHTMQYGIYKGRSGSKWTVSGNTITGYTKGPIFLAS